MENPYEWDNLKLLNEFMSACGRASLSNSNLVISFSAQSDSERAYYLRSVILSRIESVTPDIKPGDKVRPINKATKPASTNGWKRSSQERALPEVLTVSRVNYIGNSQWDLIFEEINEAIADKESEYYEDGPSHSYFPLRFSSKDFSLIEYKIPATV